MGVATEIKEKRWFGVCLYSKYTLYRKGLDEFKQAQGLHSHKGLLGNL